MPGNGTSSKATGGSKSKDAGNGKEAASKIQVAKKSSGAYCGIICF